MNIVVNDLTITIFAVVAGFNFKQIHISNRSVTFHLVFNQSNNRSTRSLILLFSHQFRSNDVGFTAKHGIEKSGDGEGWRESVLSQSKSLEQIISVDFSVGFNAWMGGDNTIIIRLHFVRHFVTFIDYQNAILLALA
jgi:hypothetical protein